MFRVIICSPKSPVNGLLVQELDEFRIHYLGLLVADQVARLLDRKEFGLQRMSHPPMAGEGENPIFLSPDQESRFIEIGHPLVEPELILAEDIAEG